MKFCGECGSPISAAQAQEVRKTVTLLFCDVTGSTTLGEQLDPEALRGVMGRYFAVARAAIEQHGGTVEKFVGDAVLAVFGVPEVREDDALRAVRAAWDLDRGLRSLSDELHVSLGVRLTVRTGVNTGPVVAGAARAGGSFATGDAVNTAARLEQAAGPGEILLGAATHALVRDAVDVEPVAPLSVKGKAEPLAAYRLTSVRPGEAGRNRRGDAMLVGRDRETRALHDALDRTLETGRTHLVTVLGAPGIGKSRLVADFLGQVDGRADVVGGRCVSYGQGITFWPVVQLLRQALALTGHESVEVVRNTLGELLGPSPDRDAVVTLLLPLLGNTGEPGAGDQTFWAVRRVLEALAVRRPLVVTVDDLHWAEPTLLELLEHVRDEVQDLPLLLVCQARPELLDHHPTWGSGSLNTTTFGLEPFTLAQTDTALCALLEAPLPTEVVTLVAEWAGGNPLFVEEIATHLVETGALVRDGDGWRLDGTLTSASMPPTVSALLAARLDRLPRDERALLERVSVIGLEMTTDEALTLSDEPEGAPASRVPALLASLSRRDFLRRVRGTSGDTWSFKHLLVREAAYDSLPKAVRGKLHERFAAVLQEGGDEAGSERDAFVAHHLEQAVLCHRQLGGSGVGLDGLVARAVAAASAAGEDSLARGDLGAAASWLERAVALRDPTPSVRRRVGLRLAHAFHQLYRVDGAREAVDAVAAELDDTTSDVQRALLRCMDLHTSSAAGAVDIDPLELERAAEAAADLARAAGDTLSLVQTLHATVHAYNVRARWGDMHVATEELRTIGSAYDRRIARLMAAGYLLYAPPPVGEVAAVVQQMAATPVMSARQEVQDGLLRAFVLAETDPATAASLTTRLMSQADELTDGASMIELNFAHLTLAHCGAVQQDVLLLERIIRTCREGGDLGHASTYLGWLALLLLELGTALDVVRPVLDETAEVTSPHDVVSVGTLEAGLAVLAARTGELDTAAAHALEAVRVMNLSDQVWQQADVYRWVSEVARRRGDLAEERRLLAEARERYRTKHLWRDAERVESRLAEIDSPGGAWSGEPT